MAIDKVSQLGDFDTITREAYRRLSSAPTPAPVPLKAPAACIECGTPLTEVQIRRGGRFCSQRCSGMHNARIPAKPKRSAPAPAPAASPAPPAAGVGILERDDLGLVHIAAALAQLLVTIPGADVHIHVGPIDLEVRR